MHTSRILLLPSLILLLLSATAAQAAADKMLRISTDNTDLILHVVSDGRIYQTYFGERLADPATLNYGSNHQEVYQGAGYDDYFEPALGIIHNDGTRCTILTYAGDEQKSIPGGTETIVHLKDEVYPVEVTLHYQAYTKENVIKTWSEIVHHEKKPVTLFQYASAMLYFESDHYFLTQYNGDWATEGITHTQELFFGKKIIDSKLGSRSAMYVSPYFELGIGSPASENNGEMLLGTLGWTGNFRFTFDVDNKGVLRLVPGINPFTSDYELRPGDIFTTPEFIFTRSAQGEGQASRQIHRWARRWQVMDGEGDRFTLLNNWENTYFSFDEPILSNCMREAKKLGVDLFLLDDGWFGNKHPRNNDRAGLGDWQAMQSKLPHGVPGLVDSARAAGVKFGIWIEPEMVNPKSELYEQHPEWVIQLPNRKTYYYRNQLVLDLCNPKVQDFVFSVPDQLLRQNPDIQLFKWDCNSMITNAYSPYLKEKQGNMYIDFTRGLYSVLRRLHEAHPQAHMMLCSGGGGRCDYEALKYFTEFWPSDNTDPVERIYMQWAYSHCFPSKVLCAHVTNWNSQTSIKFRVDVASMCKLGFDIGLKRMSQQDQQFCHEAIYNFNRLKPLILDGDQYRLVSPLESDHMAVMYVGTPAPPSEDNIEKEPAAVVFAYNINPRYGEATQPVRLQGLEAQNRYLVREINLMPGQQSRLSCHDKVYSGDHLMKVGLPILSKRRFTSTVLQLTTVD